MYMFVKPSMSLTICVSEYKHPVHSLFGMHDTDGYVLLKSSNLIPRNEGCIGKQQMLISYTSLWHSFWPGLSVSAQHSCSFPIVDGLYLITDVSEPSKVCADSPPKTNSMAT